jgi:HD domain
VDGIAGHAEDRGRIGQRSGGAEDDDAERPRDQPRARIVDAATREEMSIPARIMMIADIFEALTARDRPYKARKMLSECIDIMARMSREGHIDPDLFELFLTSGVYREYADIFVLPDQIDEVDVARYLGAPRPHEPARA